MVSSAKTREAKKAKKAEEAAEQARIALEASKKDAPDPPLDGEESQEDKDPGSPDDKDSNSDSDDGVEDTTPSVIPKPTAGHKGATASSKKRSGKRSGASSSSKKNSQCVMGNTPRRVLRRVVCGGRAGCHDRKYALGTWARCSDDALTCQRAWHGYQLAAAAIGPKSVEN